MTFDQLIDICWDTFSITLPETTEQDKRMFTAGFVTAYKIQEHEKDKIMTAIKAKAEEAKAKKEQAEAATELPEEQAAVSDLAAVELPAELDHIEPQPDKEKEGDA